MFARLATYDVPEGREGAARAAFREAVARIRECRGLVDAYVLLATEGGRTVTITLWEDRAAMAESRVVASRLRSEAAASLGGDVVSVDEFEVVADGDGTT
ncbi:MAG TPA: antibiotic biosynthesis monooxygenase [Gaiellaceae bacterium]|nr:antibiotic biosynthesis monooxygenase [Gaiellaceae bacterium]